MMLRSACCRNEIQRCVLLLNHLADHGDPEAVESELLPELLRVTGELQKRLARRKATRAEEVGR